MLKLFVVKIIESVEVSFGKEKVCFEGCGDTFNLHKSRFSDLLCSRLVEFVFAELH